MLCCFLSSFLLADQATVERTLKPASDGTLRKTKVTNDHGTMFLSLETLDAETAQVVKSTEMYFFNGAVVAIVGWDSTQELRFTQVKHDSPVAVTAEDLNNDGLVDRIVYARDDADRSFFAKNTKAFFRHERFGMLPVVDIIHGLDGESYRVDSGTETICKVCEQKTVDTIEQP